MIGHVQHMWTKDSGGEIGRGWASDDAWCPMLRNVCLTPDYIM